MIRAIRLCLVLACFTAAPGATAQIMIKGDWISLADVAPVTGEAAEILLAPAPPPGQTLALDPAFVISVAKGAGVNLALAPDTPIMVSRAAAPSTTAIKASVAPAAPVAPTPPQARSASLEGAPSPAHILVLVRDAPRGTRLSRDDLDWVVPPSPRNVRNAPEDMSGAIDMETRRSLKSGAPIMLTDLKPPAVIRKGEPVKLVYAARGLRLTVEGQAQADAASGETVRVMNNYSRRTIEAVAAENGEAHVLTR